jgi:hypothetical protein
VKNDFLLRISNATSLEPPKNPQRISDLDEISRVVDTPLILSSSPPRFVKTLKMLKTEPFFTTLLVLMQGVRALTR